MIVFRTLDVIFVIIMIFMAAITYKVKYDVQKQIGEVLRIEHEIAVEKNTVKLLRAEWATMIEPSRMAILAERYKKELNLEIIQPRQVVELEDIPVRLHDPIEELIKQYDFEENKPFLVNNRIFPMNGVVQKGMR
ncbi:hypothetical protein H704_00863 [Bartonella bacilliformis Peru38]|uniref:Cell division protein FtsL n=3 Tax=Bartonella bacilliformis TaxID=774 RepID=A1UTD2_BARBK|nr:hypothetical protein [Bartonella bacilliformis]AAT38523.1 Unknown protein [Bartonella bacilliformis]ABM45451.1 conserved hypothetical protein [Bartonella bacilliformis KC583]AMG86006.1 hypothetical protein AL467_04545 [Bartonella bacilliformis]EKS43495.1 hypothetical protein BbINS_04497 [Bartonella bacilliformis INS]EYS89677.1 hypothetical protein X472_00110 [Bartonella bacilliformis San Pedro600-02]